MKRNYGEADIDMKIVIYTEAMVKAVKDTLRIESCEKGKCYISHKCWEMIRESNESGRQGKVDEEETFKKAIRKIENRQKYVVLRKSGSGTTSDIKQQWVGIRKLKKLTCLSLRG